MKLDAHNYRETEKTLQSKYVDVVVRANLGF